MNIVDLRTQIQHTTAPRGRMSLLWKHRELLHASRDTRTNKQLATLLSVSPTYLSIVINAFRAADVGDN